MCSVVIHTTGIINNCKKRGFIPAYCKSQTYGLFLITYAEDLIAVDLVGEIRVAIAEAHDVRVASAGLRRRPEPAGSR